MPIKIPADLPANSILSDENIFCITEKRALKQDIRPLKIALLNIMPTKIVTETQLIRLLGNTPLQIEIDFLHTIYSDYSFYSIQILLKHMPGLALIKKQIINKF